MTEYLFTCAKKKYICPSIPGMTLFHLEMTRCYLGGFFSDFKVMAFSTEEGVFFSFFYLLDVRGMQRQYPHPCLELKHDIPFFVRLSVFVCLFVFFLSVFYLVGRAI